VRRARHLQLLRRQRHELAALRLPLLLLTVRLLRVPALLRLLLCRLRIHLLRWQVRLQHMKHKASVHGSFAFLSHARIFA